MWRWITLAVVIVILTAAVTAAVQLSDTSDDSAVPGLIPSPEAKPGGPLPLATVADGGDLTHKFGVMAQEITGDHEWTIKNVGEGDLKLSPGKHTCSCTVASLKDGETATLKKGESTKVKIRWETRTNDGAFEKSSSIVTNDPEHPEITFAVSGTVRPAVIRLPAGETIELGNVPNEREVSRDVFVMSPDRPELKITKATSLDPSFLALTSRPLTADELKGAPATAGLALVMTLKPGTHLGNFREEVVVQVDHPLKSEIKFPVVGRIVGPISASPETVSLHSVRSSSGGSRILALNVRDRAEPTRFEVESAPAGIKVSIRATDPKKGEEVATTRQYIMTVQVEPGTPPGEILGTLVLKTDHPKAAQVTIPLDILVISND